MTGKGDAENDNNKTGKNRIQPAEGHPGHDDREKQQTKTTAAPYRLLMRADCILRRDIKMQHETLTGKRTVKEARQKAYKVGGIWVDPMCFPFMKEYK